MAGKATKRLDTNKEAAEHLGITVWAVRERIWAGALSFVRFPGGQKMYVDELDLEALIERNKEKAALPD